MVSRREAGEFRALIGEIAREIRRAEQGAERFLAAPAGILRIGLRRAFEERRIGAARHRLGEIAQMVRLLALLLQAEREGRCEGGQRLARILVAHAELRSETLDRRPALRVAHDLREIQHDVLPYCAIDAQDEPTPTSARAKVQRTRRCVAMVPGATKKRRARSDFS